MSDSASNANEPPATEGDAPNGAWVDLEHYRVTGYQHRGRMIRVLWYLVNEVCFATCLPMPSSWRSTLLRWFGAWVGQGVVIKPRVRIKYPWKLEIGDHVWVGEGTWIDNLDLVRIGNHVCISQGVYFCTGSHDHTKRSFNLLTAPIFVGDGAWVAARSTLLGGVSIGANALVAAASMVNKNVEPGAIVGGNPARFVRHRQPPAE